MSRHKFNKKELDMNTFRMYCNLEYKGKARLKKKAEKIIRYQIDNYMYFSR